MDWKSYLPVILRYAISALGSMLVSRGLFTEDQAALFGQQLDVIVGATVALLPLVYALIKRPSSEALEVAKEADKILAGDKKEATVATSDKVPDLKITATRR